MNLQYYLHLQREMTAKIFIPATGGGYVPQKDDLVFSFDICYKDETAVVACIVDKWRGERINCFTATTKVDFPYIPRFFCFREGPPILTVLQAIQGQYGYKPDLILVDGHGTAHPEKCGLANWVGVKTDSPVIGCAKSTLLPYIATDLYKKGEYARIELNGEIVGVALITRDNVKPVFVSPGFKVSILESIHIITSLTPKYRIPEPLRAADHLAGRFAKGESDSELLELGFLKQ